MRRILAGFSRRRRRGTPRRDIAKERKEYARYGRYRVHVLPRDIQGDGGMVFQPRLSRREEARRAKREAERTPRGGVGLQVASRSRRTNIGDGARRR